MKSATSLRARPIANRAKSFIALGVLTVCFCYGSSAAFADTTYSLALPGGSAATYQWADASWTGGASGGYPGAGDTAFITRADGQNTNLDVLLGTHQLENLTYNGGTNQLRIRNYGSNQTSSLQIASSFSVEQGILVLSKQGSGHQFSIEASSTSVSSGASLWLGTSTGGVAFKSTSTVIDQGGAIEIRIAPTDSGAGFGADFGNLTNNGTLDLYGGSGTSTESFVARATSLSGAASSVVTTTSDGSGAAPKPTLRLVGEASTQATYQGVISGAVGSIAVSKEGSGVQIFSNANTYTGGTSISGGVLAVTNTSGSGLGSGLVEVSDQGVLSGTGIIALTNEAIHVSAGGAIAPSAYDTSGFATLRLSGAETSGPVLSMDENTSFTFRLGAGDQSDQVRFLDFNIGDWVINGSGGISIDATGAEIGGVYTLFTFADGNGDAIASGLTQGLTAGAGLEGYTVLFHYGNEQSQAGYGTITMEVIPEPGTVSLLLLGGALYLGGLRLRGRQTL